jgi:chromosome segregation ATPase
MAGLKVYTVEVTNNANTRRAADPPVVGLQPGESKVVEVRGENAMRRLRNRPEFAVKLLAERDDSPRRTQEPPALEGDELAAAERELPALRERVREARAEEEAALEEIRDAQRRMGEAREKDRRRRMDAALNGESAGAMSLDAEAVAHELEELPFKVWAARVKRLEVEAVLEEKLVVIERAHAEAKRRAVRRAEEAVRKAQAELERVKAVPGGQAPHVRQSRAASLRRELRALREQGPEALPA